MKFIDNIKENSVVLEFGPASGRLTRYLKNEKNSAVRHRGGTGSAHS